MWSGGVDQKKGKEKEVIDTNNSVVIVRGGCVKVKEGMGVNSDREK